MFECVNSFLDAVLSEVDKTRNEDLKQTLQKYNIPGNKSNESPESMETIGSAGSMETMDSESTEIDQLRTSNFGTRTRMKNCFWSKWNI
jgi:hypothetical protein